MIHLVDSCRTMPKDSHEWHLSNFQSKENVTFYQQFSKGQEKYSLTTVQLIYVIHIFINTVMQGNHNCRGSIPLWMNKLIITIHSFNSLSLSLSISLHGSFKYFPSCGKRGIWTKSLIVTNEAFVSVCHVNNFYIGFVITA